MTLLKKIGEYIIWLLVYLFIGLGTFGLVKIFIFDKAGDVFVSNYSFFKAANSFFSFMNDMIEIMFFFFMLAASVIAFVLFIPFNQLFIKRRAKTKKQEIGLGLAVSVFLIPIVFFVIIFMGQL